MDAEIESLKKKLERSQNENKRLEKYNNDLQEQVKLSNAKLQLARSYLFKNEATQTEIGIGYLDDNNEVFTKEIMSKCKNNFDDQTRKQNDLKDMLQEMKTEAQNADYYYDEKSKVYLSKSTGWYYYPESSSFFNPKDQSYYRYDPVKKTYDFLYKLEEEKVQEPEEDDQDSEEGEVHSDEEFKQFCNDGDFDKFAVKKKKFSPKKIANVRMIVQESETLEVGSLLLVNYKGGKIGKHDNCAVIIPDISISQIHAEIFFDIEEHQYYIQDLGSKNGTFINGKRLKTCERQKLRHEAVLTFANQCQLLVHIHESASITCDHCEPGVILKKLESENPSVYYPVTESAPMSAKAGLKTLKRKFGLGSDSAVNGCQMPDGYSDRAAIRQKAVGSDNPYEKTAAGSALDVPINAENKGFQMMKKMGWKSGKGLGADKDKNLEPIDLEVREARSGLGFGHSS